MSQTKVREFELGVNPDQDHYWAIAESIIKHAGESIRGDGYSGYNDYHEFNNEDLSHPSRSVHTDRELATIASIHGFELHDFLNILRDKVVLDIGGGYSNLQSSAVDLGVNTKIINLDLESAFCEKQDDKYTFYREKDELSVVGDAQFMPIRAESIDIALSTYSLPFWADSADQVEGWLNNVLRVVKVGGFAYISPTTTITTKDHNCRQGTSRLFGMLRTMSNMPELQLDAIIGKNDPESDFPTDSLRITKLASLVL